MDKDDKKRKRRREAKRREMERLSIDGRTKRFTSTKRALKQSDPFKNAPKGVAPYRLVGRIPLSEHYAGLREALDEVARYASVPSSKKLAIVQHAQIDIGSPTNKRVEPKNVPVFRNTPGRQIMAREFKNRTEPDRDHSTDRLRAGKICKPRPDNNRRRGGSGHKSKDFIPWC